MGLPVLIDEQNLIIAGRGRVEAAKLIGIDMVPVLSRAVGPRRSAAPMRLPTTG
jgi:ParB-like chromosome segregation protein Spo0J